MRLLWTAVRPSVVPAVLGAIVAIVAMLLLNRPVPVASPATATAVAHIESEVQAIVKAENLRAASTATTVSFSTAPGAAVLSRVTGLSQGQAAAILSASRAPTRTVATATAKLSVQPTSPPPVLGFTDEQVATIVASDQYAVRSVMNDPTTHIPVTVSLTQEEVPPSRCGSTFSPEGSGLTCALLRKNRFEASLALLARGTHLTPAIGAGILIPHTSLSGNLQLLYDRGFKAGVAIHAYF
jgi:hypothetical protein